MQELISRHLDIWTTAQIQKASGGRGRGRKANGELSPYGIKKLRELILELAVRGKLVPQDSSDKPAINILEKITQEKARLLKEGKIKKQKKLPKITEEEKPFKLPDGWEWKKLGDVGDTNIGLTYSPKDISEIGLPVLRSNNIQVGKIDLSNLVRVEKEVKDKVKVSEGDLLICARNGSKALVGKVALITDISEQMAFGAFMTIFRSRMNLYILRFIQSPLFRKMIDEVNTTTINQITQTNLRNTICPIPPLAEQHRIVVKVDELMALCDRLEQEQTNSNATHQTLLETLLTTLTSAVGHKDFATTWQRIADHFHILFTTEQSIDQLKQTILQLAVMGKLVPQNSSDEPASVLLEKIAEEKARLIKEKKIKKQKKLPKIAEVEKPFDLPEGWEWARISNASVFTEYGMSEKTFDGIDGIPVLKMGDIQSGKVMLGGQKLVPENVDGLPALYLKNRDLLYNRTNSAELVGKTGIYEGLDDAYTFASYLVRIRCSEENVLPRYLNLSMNTPLFRKTQIEPHLKQQCGQANVNATIMKNMVVSIPPLAEQRRIVTTVDELLSLCGTLKARLSESQTTQIHLADAMVGQAVV